MEINVWQLFGYRAFLATSQKSYGKKGVWAAKTGAPGKQAHFLSLSLWLAEGPLSRQAKLPMEHLGILPIPLQRIFMKCIHLNVKTDDFRRMYWMPSFLSVSLTLGPVLYALSGSCSSLGRSEELSQFRWLGEYILLGNSEDNFPKFIWFFVIDLHSWLLTEPQCSFIFLFHCIFSWTTGFS